MDTLRLSTGMHPVIQPLTARPATLNDYLKRLSNYKYDVSKMVPILLELAISRLMRPEGFPIIESGYSRTILLREPCGFEVMVARWSKGARTPIHGHPGFSLFCLIEGELSEKAYLKGRDNIMQIDSDHFSTGDYSFDEGIDGRFDNAIHQIIAVEDSLSLHLYSDDALKGEIYSQ